MSYHNQQTYQSQDDKIVIPSERLDQKYPRVDAHGHDDGRYREDEDDDEENHPADVLGREGRIQGRRRRAHDGLPIRR